MNWGDIVFRALIKVDPAEIKRAAGEAGAELDKSGIEAKGKSIGDIFSGKVATGFKLGGAAAALGFGLMTTGALESQRAQGEWQAATGRSGEEAQAFTKDMNGLVGGVNTVGKSFLEIAGFGTKVTQQFDLTGEAGTKLTDKFLGFAKVTKQGADVVDDFDATLDAWHLPAEAAAGLMDQLVASNQKYGTDAGPAALDALTKMAPALQQMGKDLDYGVGLLNLFESAGIDASLGQKALNTALANMPPGTTFDDIIAKLSAIEDPAKRGAAAAEIFGDKVGRQLANAIQPGMTSLDDFTVSAESAGGAVTTAANNMVTDADRIRMAIEKAGGILRGFGQDFGPAITGIAGLGTAFGTFLSTDLGGKLKDALAGSWSAIAGSGPVKAAVGLAASAASAAYQAALAIAEGIGNVLINGWNAMSDLAKGGVRIVIESAGKAAGIVYAAAAFVAQRLGDAAEVAWDFVSGIGAAAAKKAGGVLGKLFGEALSDNIVVTVTGAAGTIIGNLTSNLIQAVTTSWDRVVAWLSQGASGAAIAKAGAISGAIYSGAVALYDVLIGAITKLWAAVPGSQMVMSAAKTAGFASGEAFAFGFVGALLIVPILQDVAGKAKDELFKAFGARDVIGDILLANKPGTVQAGADIGAAAGTATLDAWGRALNAAGGLGNVPYGPPLPPNWGVKEGAVAGEGTAVAWNAAFADAYERGNAALPGMAQTSAQTWNSAFADAYERGNAALKATLLKPYFDLGRAIPGQIGQGMQDAANKVLDAAEQLRDLLKNGLTPKQRALKLIGQDYIDLVREGMDSKIDGAKRTAQEVALAAINTIEDAGLTGKKGKRGLKAIGIYYDDLLASGMTAAQARVALSAGGVSDSVIDGLEGKKKTVSQGAQDNLVTPIMNKLNGIDDSAYDAGKAVAQALANGMNELRPVVRTAADGLARIITNHLQLDSPAKEGVWSLRGGPQARVAHSMLLIVDAMINTARARLGALRDVVGEVAAAAIPGLAAIAGPSIARGGLPAMLSGYSGRDFGAQVSTLAQAGGVAELVRHEHSGTIKHDITERGARALRDAGFDDQRVAELMASVGGEYAYQATRFSEARRIG